MFPHQETGRPITGTGHSRREKPPQRRKRCATFYCSSWGFSCRSRRQRWRRRRPTSCNPPRAVTAEWTGRNSATAGCSSRTRTARRPPSAVCIAPRSSWPIPSTRSRPWSSVADCDSKELVDAEKAVWVLGGSKKGVITGKAKWAFSSKESAERFIKANGGGIVTFDEAIKAAYDDMYQDTKMIREFRKMKRLKHQ